MILAIVHYENFLKKRKMILAIVHWEYFLKKDKFYIRIVFYIFTKIRRIKYKRNILFFCFYLSDIYFDSA